MTEPSDPTTMPTIPGGGDEAFCPECNHSYSTDHEFCPGDGAKLVLLRSRPDAFIGRVFDDRYEVRAPLGYGGMGTVYRGWQRSVDREVAIKVIHPKLATDRVAVKRFLREARLSSRLNQPNIINVYDFGQTDDGVLFIVMELLHGHTLGRDLEAGQPLPIRRTVTIGLQLCDALEAAHNQGIIHRDLKPGNIVVLDEPPGRDLIKVLDFGLAKSLVADNSRVTHTSVMLGTPLYMPPEQIDGREADPRSDLYALGCILFQMTTGMPPYIREHVGAILQAHVHEPVPAVPVGVPVPLAAAIERLLQKNPEHRLQNAGQLRHALQAVVDSGYRADASVPSEILTVPRVAAAMAETMASTETPTGRPRKWIVIAIAIGLVAAASAAIMIGTRGDRSGAVEPSVSARGSGSDESDRARSGSGASAHVVIPQASQSRVVDAAVDAMIDAKLDAVIDAKLDAVIDAKTAAKLDAGGRGATVRHRPVDADLPELPFIGDGRN